jgi:flagellin FlaB
MIVFIAMVLVAGMAAYVLLSTSSQLQSQSSSTGQQTIQEVSTGLKIVSIEGHSATGSIDKILIDVTPRPGSPSIDLGNTLIELSNGSAKCIIRYASAFWADSTTGSEDLFARHVFSSDASQYGLLVIKDDDSSCSALRPVIAPGDSVFIAVNTTACFHGIAENVNIQGNVIPENGAWGIILFRTPSTFVNTVCTLQE